MQSLVLADYRAVLVLSGDGLIYECLNGLMDRDDWRDAIRMPIGALPGGSANAVSCSLAHLSGEAYKGLSLAQFAKSTAFSMCKAISMPMDLVMYETSDGRRVTSSLSFEWAIVADVDLESEKYRYLGGMRFAVGALKRILSECFVFCVAYTFIIELERTLC